MTNFVVGFDIGSSSSYVVIGRDNGIESVANEYSDRNTPTCISFTDKMRFVGHEAKQQQITNISNTISNFNKFLGKTFSNPIVQREFSKMPYKVGSGLNNRVAIEVSYLENKESFTPEQIYAIHLSKLKEVAEMNLSQEVKDVVINVPTYYTESERQAILDAAQIANLNCISIINDTTASALAYGIYINDLTEEKTVAFVDIGYSNFQSNIVKFNNGRMNVIASSCEQVGGCDFDDVIYRKLKKDIFKLYKLRVVDVSKPGLRLKQECEKLKKMMSANSTEIPLNIDCFMNGVDVSCKMSRTEFEELSEDILRKIKDTLKFLLRKVKLTAKDIDSVEVTGGSSRIPIVKQIISEIFMKEVRTSLNADESVARGCALQSVVISHANKVNSYRITDSSITNGQRQQNLIQYSPDLVSQFREKEVQMQTQVAVNRERLSIKNSVEEFIYENRERVQAHVTDEAKRDSILSTFSVIEDWLYGEGEDVSKQEYLNKLELLKKLTQDIL